MVPGNDGSDFLTETLKYDGRLAVKCSNYIGETIDDAVSLGMKGILLIGHVGKLVKLAAGVMNTHSRQADCRMKCSPPMRQWQAPQRRMQRKSWTVSRQRKPWII